MKTKDRNYQINYTFTNWTSVRDGKGLWQYDTGTMFTKLGMIELYRDTEFASARFVMNGRHYMRKWEGDINRRTVANQAGRYIREVKLNLPDYYYSIPKDIADPILKSMKGKAEK